MSMYDLIGFATLNGGTTGGAGGPTIEVSTDSQLSDALTANDNPAIIVVNGTIEFENINVRSNKTIQGGEDPWIQEGRFNISNASNVIVTGIRMTDAWDDSINIQYSENVWIHRNTLESGFDGLCDIKHGSNYITVSWNHFKNHDKTMLIGHDDNNGSVDIGKLKTTIHHNFFDNCIQRTPLVRFGEVHSFNNYILNTINGVKIGLDALIYQEKCFYENALRPYTYSIPPDGWVKDVGSRFVNTQTSEEDRKTDRPGGITWEPSTYYQYIAQEPDDAKRDVLAFSGHNPMGLANITSPENNDEFTEGSNIPITTDAESGTIDLMVNGNIVDTKSSPPYIFSFVSGSIDTGDYLLNLKFDGNLNENSVYNNIVNLINPEKSSYVEGARGQGILLEEGDTWLDDSYISVSPSTNLLNLNGPFTVAYWLKGEPGRTHQLFGNRAADGTGIYAYTLSDGRTDFFIYTEETTYTLRSISSGQDSRLNGQWEHYTWRYDGDWLRCLFNGEQTNSVQVGQIDFPASSQEFRINRSAHSNNRSNLAWDDFRIYDYAVTDIESLTTDNFLGPLTLQVRRAGVTSDPVTINIVEELPTFTITATATTGGQVSGDGEYEENEEVTLTATPDSGYEFVRWEEDSETVSTANPYIFNAEGDRVLLAVFQQIEYQLTVTYTAGGSATGSGIYTEGEQVELTATPNSGYIFTGWYRDSDLISEANPYNYTTRGQADTVQARFELIPIPEFTITVIPSTGGTVTGGGTYEEGQSVTLSAMPQSGWTFVKWSNEATANPYSFNASENLTISAIFEEVNPEVPYIIVKGKFKIV